MKVISALAGQHQKIKLKKEIMKMKNEELVKIKEMVEEKYDEIIEKIIEAKKEAEGYAQGMHVSVIIDSETGKIFYTGAMSQGGMTQGQFDGTDLTIADLDCWEVGWDGYDYNFDDAIKLEDDYEKMDAEYEKVKDGDDEYFDSLYDFVKSKYPEVIEKLDNDCKEELIDDWFPEMAAQKLDSFIENLDAMIKSDY